MPESEKAVSPLMKFKSVRQADVPKGRDGKHKEIVTQLLSDIEQLAPQSALKIPLADLPDSKENIRAALSRAATQKRIAIATSSNEEFLYYMEDRQHRVTSIPPGTRLRQAPGVRLRSSR
jgi:hypothetical protein